MKSEIYQPAEDSYLLSETLEKYLKELIIKNNNKSNIKLINSKTSNQQKPHIKVHKINNINNLSKPNIKEINILDMGTGTGIQALICRKLGFNNILTADINKEAVKHLKKQGFESKQSNLFEKINKKQKKDKFNLIIFNPPYLPEDKYDKEKDTTAGKQGYELIIKFLKQAIPHLSKNGVILLLFSSLSKPKVILKTAKGFGYNYNLLNNKKLFFEELFVYVLNLKIQEHPKVLNKPTKTFVYS